MNLTITPKLNAINNRNIYNYNQQSTMPNNFNTLNKDTVSFSGKERILKYSKYTMQDVTLSQYERNKPLYTALANRLMDTLESIANELKSSGVIFDRDYCEKNAIKKSDSFISKFIRSGETPQDRVRSTLFLQNIYDLSIMNDKILPALKKRGYEVAIIPDKTAGKRVLSTKADFDVRLTGLSDKDKKSLAPALRNAASFKPQSSGYEDIQFRIVDTLAGSKGKQIPIEVITVFGKKTSEAKHNESYYVYDIKKLFKLFHLSSVKDPEIHSPAKRIQTNISTISQQLTDNISKPLFFNAKNLDFYNDKTQLPVGISKATSQVLIGLAEGIKNKIPLHYKEEFAKVNSEKYQPAIEKLIKNSDEYKTREDKTIYVDDIKEMRKTLVNQLKQERREDLQIINEAIMRLKETINKFGKKN
ncbi:MAG: hypothetical protein LKG27_02760 [Clostridiaceae bacterium]|jgi:hypothetical protein|nr:hypothetical protein [Clostridiaceae bacterium]